MYKPSLHRAFALFILALFPPLVIGCSDSGGTTDAGPPDMARRIVDLTGTRSGIGESCKAGRSARGTCKGDDAQCITDGQYGFTDGYCVQDCTKTACPSDADCVELAPGFDLCMALCNTDADCRSGYHCTDYNICEPELGIYLGSAIRPGTNAGEACDPAPQTPSTDFEPNNQLSTINGAQTTLAVDDANGNVVVAWVSQYGDATIQVASSQDGGATFNPPIQIPADNLVDNNATQANPVAAVDSTGTFFIAWGGRDNDPAAIYVARSTNGGLTFPDVFVASPRSESLNDFLSKPSIAISPDNTIYISWATSFANQRIIRIVSSKDGGATWTAPVTVTPDDMVEHEFGRIAATNSAVYVTWVEVNGDQNGDVKNKIGLQKLTPSLSPVGSRVVMSGVDDAVAVDVPSIAVNSPNVYVVYSAGSPQGQWDIRAAYSLDDGATVKPSVKVNSDATCATHFHPTASVDGAGQLHVAFYDNRNLDGAVRHTSGTVSSSGALTFTTEGVVNDMPFPFTTESGYYDWLGDYLGMATPGDHIYIGWADTRTNDTAQIFFTRAGF